jgi:RNA polymerase sigma factor (sigma-70 family)
MRSLNEYTSVLPGWQVELAARRIRAWRFRGADIDDAMQEAVLALLDHVYDPQAWHGATEKQAALAVIERRLGMIRRRERRYRQRVEQWQSSRESTDQEPSPPVEELALDLGTVLTAMPERTRQVGRGLLEGESLNEIAIRLRISWSAVRREVFRLRAVLQRAGLDPRKVLSEGVSV